MGKKSMLRPGSINTPEVVVNIFVALLETPQRILTAFPLSASKTTPTAFAGAAVDPSVVVTVKDPVNVALVLTTAVVVTEPETGIGVPDAFPCTVTTPVAGVPAVPVPVIVCVPLV